MGRNILRLAALFCWVSAAAVSAAQNEVRNLEYFLHQMRSVENMPILENSHTAMSSTYDRQGDNRDDNDFKDIRGNRNILLDINGPGCIHRIFTGVVGKEIEGTKIQIFLDDEPNAVFDMPVYKFFDYKTGPIPYPLVFHKTYPGTLFPIPFARHCLVQLVNDQNDNWGNYWQVTYTIYPPKTKVESLRWPLSERENKELEAVRQVWLKAEANAPAPPLKWSVDKKLEIAPSKTGEIKLERCGIIREMRISVKPNTPEALRGIRMRIYWDGAEFSSVDVPLGYFFGNADYGDKNPYSSLLLGVTGPDAYSKFPMPFARGAVFKFTNETNIEIEKLNVRLDIEKCSKLAPDMGRFHATWTEHNGSGDDIFSWPAYGKLRPPTHVVLERNSGPGKYVGVLLHVAWPSPKWWGEGDWLIWTDELGWPPSYHGTGSEEYFNSGWCRFDRKAVSGFVAVHPGNVAVYSFHLNDAFQFSNNIRVAEEKWTHLRGDDDPFDNKVPCLWGSTAFWYALPAQPAGSRQDLIQPRIEFPQETQ
jgi:hypothetical protein